MTYNPTKISRVRPGRPVSAEQHNKLIDAINRLQSFTGDGRYIAIDASSGGVRAKWIGPAIHHSRVQPYRLFVVRVWRDGGTTDGDASNQCDRTYTVRTLNATGPSTGGIELGTGMTPGRTRPPIGKLITPATTGAGVIGTGYRDEDGAFQLYDASEHIDTGTCS